MLGNNDVFDRPPSGLRGLAMGEDVESALVLKGELALRLVKELSSSEVRAGGSWLVHPTRWCRYDRPWSALREPGDSHLIGTIWVDYGCPTRADLTITRIAVTERGRAHGWSVSDLRDDLLRLPGHVDLDGPTLQRGGDSCFT
jgi:hypothetical protein